MLGYPYFEHDQPYIWEGGGTYVEIEIELTKRSVNWSHGLGEIVTALLKEGLIITGLVEHNTVPWEALPGKMTRVANGEWQISERPERLPHTYTLRARKPG